MKNGCAHCRHSARFPPVSLTKRTPAGWSGWGAFRFLWVGGAGVGLAGAGAYSIARIAFLGFAPTDWLTIWPFLMTTSVGMLMTPN